MAASGIRRYFFDMRIGEDDEGADLENLEAVQKEALRVLAAMARELSRFPVSMAVEVRDDGGRVVDARVVFDIHRTN